jgi:hypothetical protein
MKMLLLSTIGMIMHSSMVAANEQSNINGHNPQVYAERFDHDLSPMARALLNKKYVRLVKKAGIRGSNALQVTYQGYEEGSHRITAIAKLPQPALQYNLSFSVKFCRNFDFTLGGKLHGLGPAQPVTGGNKVGPSNWSARLMFERDGGLRSYIYHQDMHGKFGDSVKAQRFRFKLNQYHQIQIQLSLNTAANKADGKMITLVDGVEVIRHEHIRFRQQINDDTLISKLMFNTFHGGASPEWAPRTQDKKYKAVCAYFDDFVVTKPS